MLSSLPNNCYAVVLLTKAEKLNMETSKSKLKEVAGAVILVILAAVILKNLYFNFMTFDRLAYFDGKSPAQQTIGSNNQNPDSRIAINFPQDEGEHQNLQTEWWYLAAHLEDEKDSANKFGATLMFSKNPPQILFNLTDGVNQKNFSSVIKLDGFDLLGKDKLAIKKDDIYWLESGVFKYQIHFKFEDIEINLDLASLKKPFLFYNNTEAFYYEQTNIKVSGSLFLSDNHYQVKGVGWIDHQGFRTVLPWKSWRWYALQLDNNVEIVFTTDLVSQTGNFSEKKNLSIFKESALQETVDSQKYTIKNLDFWQDPKTKVQYPIKWQLEIPERNINLTATSIIPNQVIEGTGGVYEGTYQVTGTFEGQSVMGHAQFEFMP